LIEKRKNRAVNAGGIRISKILYIHLAYAHSFWRLRLWPHHDGEDPAAENALANIHPDLVDLGGFGLGVQTDLHNLAAEWAGSQSLIQSNHSTALRFRARSTARCSQN